MFFYIFIEDALIIHARFVLL
jgi:WD40 repeat protein